MDSTVARDNGAPDELRNVNFWYTNDDAHNVREFFTAVRTLPEPSEPSLRHHLASGEFSRTSTGIVEMWKGQSVR